jgi:hypothetical protein
VRPTFLHASTFFSFVSNAALQNFAPYPRRSCCRPLLPLLLLAGWLALGTGCATLFPGRGSGGSPALTQKVELPARLVANFFIVEAKQIDGATYRFIIDTGSSATLVSPELAGALREKRKRGTPQTVRVQSAQGDGIDLESVTLRSLALGDARFEKVPALIYRLDDLSSHLGLQIDGIIGFPFFHNTLVTLDYPRARLVLAPQPFLPAPPPPAAPRTCTIAFNNERLSPLVPLQMGTESFIVLIDSGSDGALSLNPSGLHPKFLSGPREGMLITSLTGDHRPMVGRLAQNVLLGTHTIERPIVDLTDQLSSIGGEFLRHFALTFDQYRNQVTLVRDTDGPAQMDARRSTGLSFSRSNVYWRVLGVVPDTPAARLPVQTGDLCVRVNGEPVGKWDYERYSRLLKTEPKVTYTFLDGLKEIDLEIPVVDLVP